MVTHKLISIADRASSLGKMKSKWNDDSEDSEAEPAAPKAPAKKIKVAETAVNLQESKTANDFLQSSPPVIIVKQTSAYLVGPKIAPCRSIDEYENLNLIDEGSYGIVKLEKEKNGFPVTSLREIHTLLLSKHPNIVEVLEILVKPNVKSGFYIAMEFIEHDLKSLMQNMKTPFLASEVKTIMTQLLSAAAYLHKNWIIHRDLKTSNLLMNNRGQIKIADFGLARRFSDPLGDMTQLVVTLWYRAPELLLGATSYSMEIDVWSIGCIFAELINNEPLVPGTTEIEQLNKIFKLFGTPDEEIWPGYEDLPHVKSFGFTKYPSVLLSRFPFVTENTTKLLQCLLRYDPLARITADAALIHAYFSEAPAPKDPDLFPTWPSKSAGERIRKNSPSAPHGHIDNEEELRNALGAHSFQDTSFKLRI